MEFRNLVETNEDVAEKFLERMFDFVLSDPPYNFRYERNKSHSWQNLIPPEDMSNLVKFCVKYWLQKCIHMCSALRCSFQSGTRTCGKCRKKGQISKLIQKMKHLQGGRCLKCNQLHYKVCEHCKTLKKTHA